MLAQSLAMEITDHDDVESRGRLAPHEVPLAMASVLCVGIIP
eukprot:COSAG02_NODE_31253_length_536_cov_1.846682_1_plen_42_part_00